MKKIDNIYIYAKQKDNIEELKYVLLNIDAFHRCDNVYISQEPRRSFTELEKIKEVIKENDVCIITNPASLGLNEAEIVKQIEWFIQKPRILLIYDFSATYSWGIYQPMNQAILQTIQQSVLIQSGKHIVKMPENRKSNAGRSRVDFPENWEELYDEWERKIITSKEFLEKSGLKRATFYNMITEYREIKEEKNKFYNSYKTL
ncbi:hypothetical protein [Schwartzia succinivorans]|jgi:hypothetical protein|uniref:Resolvase, N terminal domain n=1 Tax=Schwartzia succinivorans DSM 10502 TaxID=1123243 RepID=A0A1M4YJ98_9FIRM|nr:hypothetical protein [Schwartzia succinivorans]SHF05476.1 hypothetical protein SAMN02745190_01763 [Schwartzia succinivorans DSM 10502]